MKHNRPAYRALFIPGLIIGLACLLGPAICLYPLDDEPPIRGDSAMADRYALWAKSAIDQGLWKEALAGLERATDFADVSSDIGYLLALARSHEGKSRSAVLEALNMALAADHWVLFKSEEARLLKIDRLIALKFYNEALLELSWVSKGPKEAELTLKTLAASNPIEFRRYAKDALDLYPREGAVVWIILRFFKAENKAGKNPGSDDLALIETIIRRLPLLVEEDAELAWMAAPFMRDTEEARRLVRAYRASRPPLPESIPAALRLGIIDELNAVQELFSFASRSSSDSSTLDISLIGEVWELLRRELARLLLSRSLSQYSGVLIEDADGDGIPETYAEYNQGLLWLSKYDPVQDGIPSLEVFFEGAFPRRAFVLIPPESTDAALSTRKEAAIEWERYPAILRVELDGAVFIPRPLELNYSPVLFTDLWNSGVLFPRRDPLNPPLTRRVLVSQSLRVERPSLEFSGGREIVELNQGIPVRAREYVGDLMVSETEFLRGRPQLQRLDLDFDGKAETVRRFKRSYGPAELEELWDYEREYEYDVEVDEWE